MEAAENIGNYRSQGSRMEAQTRYRRSPSHALGGAGDDGGDSLSAPSSNGGGPRLYHTLTACTRCRSRKTRCDAGLPKCSPCERTGAHCEFFDSTKQKTIPRNYIIHLQNRVRTLEAELARRESTFTESDESPNSQDLLRGIGAVKFGDDDEHYKEPRYVGPASGVTVTRLVLESAKKDLDPDEFQHMTVQHRHAFRNTMRTEASPPRELGVGKVVPDARLPPRHFGERLVTLFCRKSLYMLPVLHEPTFLKEVADVYEGSMDPFKTFKLKMVLAISLQKYSVAYSTWADSYFLSGLQDLEKIMEPMDHNTLQCLLVMVQYALVKPTRIAAYHMVGICVRLCIQLGYHQERTIMLSELPLDPIKKDMRRRLFWTTASMEYGLSQVLGRPSAFATSDAHIDVSLYAPISDEFITTAGILPGPISTKKLISMHFFRMRRLQAEIRHTLYQNPRPTPRDDTDPWFIQMRKKCDDWKADCPNDDEGSGFSEGWFNHRYNNILLFMYRPSPQIPQPSKEATFLCYDLAVKNVEVEKQMVERKTADVTWVFMHQIYTVTLTIIWTIYDADIRRRHPRSEVERYINSQIQLLTALNERWPGADAAADLFARLAQAAMKNYELDSSRSPEIKHASSSTASSSASPTLAPPPPTTQQSQPYVDQHSPMSNPLSPGSPDLQKILTDPSFLQAMFFNHPAAGTSASSFIESWEPTAAATGMTPGIPTSAPTAASVSAELMFAGHAGVGMNVGMGPERGEPGDGGGVNMGGEVLDRSHQHDELAAILEMERGEYNAAMGGMHGGMPGGQWTGFNLSGGGGLGVGLGVGGGGGEMGRQEGEEGERPMVFKTEPGWG